MFGRDGKKVGEDRIEPIAGGCALLENWEGVGGASGKSLNIYDARDEKGRTPRSTQNKSAGDVAG